MNAESHYLFRHALVRDAAYELQLPHGRAQLHDAAADVLKAVHAGALAPAASEIADHLNAGGIRPELERHFTQMAAQHARDNYNHEEAIRLYRRLVEIGEPKQQVEAHQLLYGTLRAFRNDVEGAREHAFALWRAGRHLRAPGVVSAALNSLAGLEKPARAIRLYRRSYRVARKVEAWMQAAIAIGNLGAIYHSTGDLRRARRLIARSIDIHRRGGNPVGEGFFLCTLSGILRGEEDYPAALRAARRGIEILEALDARRYLTTAYGHLASALEKLGRFGDSEDVLSKAEELAMKIQFERELWKIRVHRALVALERGQTKQALEHWGRVSPWLIENGRFDELEEARSDLQRAGTRLDLLPPEAWRAE